MSEVQANTAELNQMLGDPSKDLAYCHNYAYIVTVILSQVGMNRTQNNIEDKGAVQSEISKGQTQFASMQQFMALLEGNTQWDSKKKEAYWPSGFESSHTNDITNFANAFGQFFLNTGANADNSTTTTSLNIDFTLPSEFAGFPPQTKIIINPCANKVLVTAPGKAPKIYTGTGTDNPFHYVLSNEQTYIKKVMKYVTGSTTIPADGSTVPQYLATAMASLQSNIDDAPESFFSKCFVHSNEYSGFAGNPNDNPLITSAEQLYANFNEADGVNGSPVATNILNVYEQKSGATNELWNDMAGMMANWMQNKMSNQSSTSGDSAPSGSIYITPKGVPSNEVWSYDSSSVVSELNSIAKYIDDNGGLWFERRSCYDDVTEHMIPAVQASGGYDFSSAIRWAKYALADMTDFSGPGKGFKAYGELQGVIGKLQTLENEKNAFNGQFHSMTETGLFNQVQSSISMGASTYQSQTQQNAAAVQQQSSMLTSYDQIGQSIITAMNKAEQTIAGNLKSS